ncbi:MAG: hypothetical protein NXI16_16495 [Alphaproteobacteria bacterium]|nr:hypothetical protein [Alphaproteobacteria bacterium]
MELRDIGETLDYYGRFTPEDSDHRWRWVKDIYRYVFWFEYLALSPSYELARRYRTGSALDESDLPADFDDVLSVYDDLGDVQRILFRQWWRKIGLPNFGFDCEKPKVWLVGITEDEVEPDPGLTDELGYFFEEEWVDYGKQETLILAVPTGLPSGEINAEINQILDQVTAKRQPHKPPPAKYQLAEGRFRADALRRYFRLVQYQAQNPSFPHWKVGFYAFSEGNEYDDKRVGVSPCKLPDVDQKKNLANSARRSIEHARMIAENAARGQFPTHTPHPHALAFDFFELRDLIDQRNKWQKSEVKRLIRADQN